MRGTVCVTLVALVSLLLPFHGHADAVHLVVTEEAHRAYQVSGSFTVHASPHAVWSVLTDYDHLSEIVPSLEVSHVHSHVADVLLLEQVARGHIWIFTKHMRVLLRVEEYPPHALVFSDIAHTDFVSYVGSWKLEREGTMTNVHYEVFAELQTPLPRFFVRRALTAMATELLEKLQEEINRRSAPFPREQGDSGS